MMCSTFSISTEYCSTLNMFRSVCTTMLAMLRCTKISPGLVPVTSLAGTRLSLQPIQRYFGDCSLASVGKKPGSFSAVCRDHSLLFASSCLYESSLMLLCSCFGPHRSGLAKLVRIPIGTLDPDQYCGSF